MASVIVLNYNGLKNLGGLLEDCLEFVFNTDYPYFEVLFVDNASTDDSVGFVKRNFGQNEKIEDHSEREEFRLSWREQNRYKERQPYL
jgi:GT2 family glycosyltransferase